MQGIDSSVSEEIDSHPESEISYILGDFLVLTQSKILLKSGEEVTIEPQVLEVLIYMCENASHYVLLQDLHDNVWKERVVSDAAVRRSISKLRALLSDGTEQQYIKSQHKRGYKLDYNVEKKTLNLPSLLSDYSAKNTSKPLSDLKNTFTNNAVSKRLIYAALLLLCLITYFGFQSIQEDKVFSNLVDFPGEKVHVTVSESGKYIAFAGKVFDFQGYQLFIAETDTLKVRQVTNDANNIVRAAIDESSGYVYFIDMSLGQSKLSRVAIDQQTYSPPEVLIDDYYLLSDVDVANDGESLYFSGVKEKNQTSNVYSYQYSSEQVIAITEAQAKGEHDYRVALNSDKKLLAVATTKNRGTEQEVTVYNIQNWSVKTRILHPNPIYSLIFDKNNNFYILDTDQLTKINIGTGEKTIAKDIELDGVIGVDLLSEGQFVALKIKKKDKIYIEISLPEFNANTQRLVEKGKQSIQQLAFSHIDNTYFIIEENDGVNTLSIRPNNGKDKQVLLETTMSMRIVEASSDGSKMLMFIDGLLALFDTLNGEIDYISTGSEHLYNDAAFSLDDRAVYYGIQTNASWQVRRYDLSSKMSDTLIPGFKSLREVNNGLLLVGENGKLFFSESLDSVSAKTPLLDIYIEPPWHSVNDYVYWNDFDGKHIVFNAYNFKTDTLTSSLFSKSHVEHEFDVNPNGTNALLIRTNLPDTDIQVVSPTF
jgi:DNA-binding winged helix-turn-helix (wHTH) protein